jgi:hydroxymethylbilane synthase
VAGMVPGGEARLEVIRTLGDHLGTQSPSPGPQPEEPQGLFTRELDEALLSGRIRAGVHSLKDVPTQLAPGIRYGAFLKREDPRDAFISRDGKTFAELPAGSRLGTSSPRRESQVRAIRPDLKVVPFRGNVDTRLRKLAEGEVDALVLAAAGLKRLGREKEATEWLVPEVMLPAPAQGVICITLREDDGELLGWLKPLDDEETRTCAMAERAFLRTLQGGCRIPVGALARQEGEVLHLSGLVALPSGEELLRHELKGDPSQPEKLGRELASVLLSSGAREILESFGRTS